MEQREITCINCPLGCLVQVQIENQQIIKISGNTCKRGEDYACKEVTHPMRIITSTIAVQDGRASLVSCKTQSDVPKEMIFECMKVIKKAYVCAPVRIGDVLIHNVAGTGVDVIATRNVE